jgi:hypothetical protein
MADNDLAQAIQTDPLEGIVPILKRQTEKSAEQRGRQEKATEAEFLAQEFKYTKPAPEFKPTEESMSGFAAMGSLLAAAGAILGSGGRSSGLMAMNAVSGMMNGYNAGRKDLYEQQRQQFEENMKSWEKHREQVKDLFAQAAKLAPYNLSKAQQYLNDGLKSLGMQPLAEVNQRSGPIAAMSTFNRADQNMTSVLAKAQVQTSGLLNSVPPEQRGMFEQMLNSKDPKDVLAALEGLQAMKKTKTEALKEQYGLIKESQYGVLNGVLGNWSPKEIYEAKQQPGGSFEKRAAPSEKPEFKEVQITGPDGKPATAYLNVSKNEYLKGPDGQIALAPPKAGAGGRAGVYQQLYNNAMTGANAEMVYHIQNIASLPDTAKPPSFDNLLTDPKKSTSDSLVKYFQQAITPEEDRLFQAYQAGLKRNLAYIDNNGRPPPKNATDLYDPIFPTSGDSKIVRYAMLALMKQTAALTVTKLESGMGSPEQIAQAKKSKEAIDKIVTWNIDDINRIVRANGDKLINPKVVSLLATSNNLDDFGQTGALFSAPESTVGQDWTVEEVK